MSAPHSLAAAPTFSLSSSAVPSACARPCFSIMMRVEKLSARDRSVLASLATSRSTDSSSSASSRSFSARAARLGGGGMAGRGTRSESASRRCPARVRNARFQRAYCRRSTALCASW